MNIAEWYSSFDVYAIEYSDIRENYRIIYGENIICYKDSSCNIQIRIKAV